MTVRSKTIQVVAIQGSVRSGNNTAKVLAVAKAHATARPDAELHVIDPTELTFHLPGRGISADAKQVQEHIKKADAVILATPEYHGSYSSVMKLIIDNLGFPSALKRKPVCLLGVASGAIGAIKALEHLRSVASHVGALVLPGPVSVANVKNVFDEDDTMVDLRLKAKIEQGVDDLIDYAKMCLCPEHTLEGIARDS